MTALLLAVLMASAESGCKASTDIEQFKGEIQKACGPRIKSVVFNGTQELAALVITYDLDLLGLEIGGTERATQAWDFAVLAGHRLQEIYPMKHFIFGIRDQKDRPVCAFDFAGGEMKEARCVGIVE